MLIVALVELQVLAHLMNVLFKLFDFLSVFDRLSGDLSHLCRHIGVFKFVVGHGKAVFIELKESFNKLKEEEVVVVEKGVDSVLGVDGGAVGVAFIGDFIS